MCSVNTVLSKHPFPFAGGSGLARRISTSRRWSVQPCVWLHGAVHMTAGHKTLRGSGPGHKPAFDNAMALVGCPDRRIDRLKETVVACVRLALDGNPRHTDPFVADRGAELVHLVEPPWALPISSATSPTSARLSA
jgi:hypothetical protein